MKTNAKRFLINTISAVNNQGLVRFMIYKENMTERVLLRFMKRLIKDAGGKVYLVLDNLRIYHAKLVKAWRDRHLDKIEVFYLPSYSPELEPDEYLTATTRKVSKKSSLAKNVSDLNGKVLGHLRILQKNSKRVGNSLSTFKSNAPHNCIFPPVNSVV